MDRKTGRFLLSLCILGAVIWLLSRYGIQLYFISGSSMEPTYHSGEAVLLQKFGMPDALQRGDAIVLRAEQLHRTIIKRLVALPGDTVEIRDGILYVNAIPEDDSFGFDNIENAGVAATPIVLGTDEYFVLGDNRNSSIDSRFEEVGILSAGDILGKVLTGF